MGIKKMGFHLGLVLFSALCAAVAVNAGEAPAQTPETSVSSVAPWTIEARPRVGYATWTNLAPTTGSTVYGVELGAVFSRSYIALIQLLSGSAEDLANGTTRLNWVAFNPGYVFGSQRARLTLFGSVGTHLITRESRAGDSGVVDSRLLVGGGLNVDLDLWREVYLPVSIQNLVAVDVQPKVNVLVVSSGLGLRF